MPPPIPTWPLRLTQRQDRLHRSILGAVRLGRFFDDRLPASFRADGPELLAWRASQCRVDLLVLPPYYGIAAV